MPKISLRAQQKGSAAGSGLFTLVLMATPPTRYDPIDALRGLAMLWMTAFHFCFDLNHLGYIKQNFYDDPLWTWQRTCILSLFLFTAGVGQALALQQGPHGQQNWPQFWRRWRVVAGCALLVTAGSYWMYPQSFIYFGTLHGIAVMLVLVRWTAGLRGWLWPLGAVAIAIIIIANSGHSALENSELSTALNSPQWNWLGFITHKPVTEDYVPLLPWLGVMWWGVASGQWVLKNRPQWLVVPAPPKLALLGRWSLSYYMLHQPVMIGVLSAFRWCVG